MNSWLIYCLTKVKTTEIAEIHRKPFELHKGDFKFMRIKHNHLNKILSFIPLLFFSIPLLAQTVRQNSIIGSGVTIRDTIIVNPTPTPHFTLVGWFIKPYLDNHLFQYKNRIVSPL